jgi:hypothetical protein
MFKILKIIAIGMNKKIPIKNENDSLCDSNRPGTEVTIDNIRASTPMNKGTKFSENLKIDRIINLSSREMIR